MIHNGREYVPASELSQARLDSANWRRRMVSAELELARVRGEAGAIRTVNTACNDALVTLALKCRNSEKDLKLALVVMACVAVALIAMSFKYLDAVNRPVQNCLQPATFKSTVLELAAPAPKVDVTI